MQAYVYGGAAILAVGMIISGFLIGGRFTVVATNAGPPSIVVVDRLTGSAKVCFIGSSCRGLKEENSN